MADVRESFTTLEGASQEGLALRAVQEGNSVASKNGSIAFGFKDNSGNAIAAIAGAAIGAAPTTAVPVLGFLDSTGNLTAPQLNAAGQLPVTFAAAGNGKKQRGTVGGSLSLVTVASLTLAVSKTYDQLDFIVSCFRDARFQVILSDNAVETIISDALCGPGQFTVHAALKEAEIVSGATGPQLLLIKALNLNALSDFYASLSVNES